MTLNRAASFPVRYHGAEMPYGSALALAAAANHRTVKQMRKTVDSRRRAGWPVTQALEIPPGQPRPD